MLRTANSVKKLGPTKLSDKLYEAALTWATKGRSARRYCENRAIIPEVANAENPTT